MERSESRLFARLKQVQVEREQQQQRSADQFSGDELCAEGNKGVEMTPHYIRSRRFGRRLLGGLNPEEVKGFLEEVADALDTAQTLNFEMGMRVKSLEAIKHASVTPSDAFQAGPAATESIRQDEHNDAAAPTRLERLRSTALQEIEALLHDAQLRAEALTDAANERAARILREADELKALRQNEAEDVVAAATATAESILTTARDEEACLRREINGLVERRFQMFDDVRGTLNACDEWLATVDPRRRCPAEVNVLSESLTTSGPA
jgi:DivIVA domain-containing protein